MSRHSKNNTASMVFTHHERKNLGLGVQTALFGRDSLRKLEQCALCLHTLVDPVCCKKGHLYCKKCIVESIAAQKKEIERQLQKWEDLQKQQQTIEHQKETEIEKKQIEEFEKTTLSVVAVSTPAFKSKGILIIIQVNNQQTTKLKKWSHLKRKILCYKVFGW
jgi:nitric oxide synthase-interacting protein